MPIYLTKQVEKEIEAETKEIQEKLTVLFVQLNLGMNLSMPTSRSIVGHPGLKELRLRDIRGIVRVFYYVQNMDQIFILSLFRKKTQKTPVREIRTALQRLRKLKEEFYV